MHHKETKQAYAHLHHLGKSPRPACSLLTPCHPPDGLPAPVCPTPFSSAIYLNSTMTQSGAHTVLGGSPEIKPRCRAVKAAQGSLSHGARYARTEPRTPTPPRQHWAGGSCRGSQPCANRLPPRKRNACMLTDH